jgi:GAF domain-containing protein
MFLSYTCSHRVIARFLLGDPLADVKEENERMLALMNKKNLSSAAATQTIVLQTIRCLQGLTRSAQTLDDETFEEATFVESIEASRMTFAMSWFSTAKGILLFLDQDYVGALLALIKALTLTPIAFTPEARYYTCLSILALADTATAEERAEREPILARSRGDLEAWANACPENYLAKSLLVQAESARVSGEAELAMELYDRAIAAAREYDWPRDIALGNERCALFYLQRGRTRIARAYMTDACYAYARWGATSPLRRLVEKYPTLVPAEMQTTTRGGLGVGATETVDTLAFVRGLQAISRQIHLEDIVEQVMRIVVHDAGAERGVLLLQREGALVVFASFVADSKQVVRGLHEPLAPLTDSADLATSVVRYVARLGESVILEDARKDPHFAADAYIAAVQSRSIACLAITHQGLLKGVLYLENNGVAAAFTAGRAELLRLLASQAAISIDNAELYARAQSAKDALSRTNDALQAEVSQQTIELRETNTMLERELAERILAEEREIRMRENIIQIQTRLLAEMSTPVLPILKGIIIIPLIGSLDEVRATEVLDVAIRGAFERSARVVILDVTGIGRVDSTIDSLLGRTARALALVGAELLVTGIRSAMAMELSRHATEVASIKTYATLESGVVVALKRLGRTGA